MIMSTGQSADPQPDSESVDDRSTPEIDADEPDETDEPGETEEAAPAPEGPVGPRRRAALRLALLALIIGGLVLGAWATGLTDQLTTENVRNAMQDAGAWGVLIFVGVFILGNLIQIPSNVFIAAAIYAYGFTLGMPMSYGANVVSVCVSFVFVRAVGGQPLTLVKRPLLRKILNRLDDRPILSIALLRVILGGSPPLTYTLAMSEVRFRDYLAGSMTGMIVPVTIVSAGLAWFWD